MLSYSLTIYKKPLSNTYSCSALKFVLTCDFVDASLRYGALDIFRCI